MAVEIVSVASPQNSCVSCSARPAALPSIVPPTCFPLPTASFAFQPHPSSSLPLDSVCIPPIAAFQSFSLSTLLPSCGGLPRRSAAEALAGIPSFVVA